jgi:POT family proton-dependent oligopeptide transporter
VRGVLRSMRIYYGNRERRTAMDCLYAQFIRRGDLVFDIGAHVGDRIAAFRRLGARVVAIEPQPALVMTLKLLYGRDRAVAIEPVAVGRTDGALELRLNLDNPTLSTASDALVRAAARAPGWQGESWTRSICVPVLSLDTLIERHGCPAFIKIDVEGFEAEVLAGVTQPVPALSFEFTTIQPQVASHALARCAELGYGRYNAAFGESHSLVHREWLSADEIGSWLSTLPLEANSGDIYAVGAQGMRGPERSLDFARPRVRLCHRSWTTPASAPARPGCDAAAGEDRSDAARRTKAERAILQRDRKARVSRPELLGHPRGLAVLFATEMWERFSYFGNAALIVLYMVKHLLLPGAIEAVLGFGAVKTALEFILGHLDPQPLASQIFGLYTGLAYCTPILGGLVADRWLGTRRTVVLGGILMALGHFLMAFEALFLVALLLLILGIGAFKPNISTQVGALYAPGDHRRDRAYSIFYVGINIGALLAPLVCGTLAAAFGWHWGFGAAGIGMLVSLGIYLYGRQALPRDDEPAGLASRPVHRPLDPIERRAAVAIVAVCLAVALFWAAYDQQGNTLLLWAEDFTDRTIDLAFWRGDIPAPWFLALNPLFIFALTPVIVQRWARQGEREPSPVRKMAFGAGCVALANMVMAAAAWSATGKASGLWLVGYFALATLGELHLAPVGLALISRIAPVRALAMFMGLWFAATLPADIFGGFLGGFWSTMAKPHFFIMIAAIAGLAAIALALLACYVPCLTPRGINGSMDRSA